MCVEGIRLRRPWRATHSFSEIASFRLPTLQAAHAHFSHICEKTVISHRVDGWGVLQLSLHVAGAVRGGSVPPGKSCSAATARYDCGRGHLVGMLAWVVLSPDIAAAVGRTPP